MTIAQAFNEIAVAQGGTASTSGTIAGAIDALNDALAGSDQQAAQTIEDAVRLLGQNIGGGCGGGGSSVNHATMPVIAEDAQYNPIPSQVEIQHIYYQDSEYQYHDISFTTTTYTYDDGETTPFETTALVADLPVGYPICALFPEENPALIDARAASMGLEAGGMFAVCDPSAFGNALVVLTYNEAI